MATEAQAKAAKRRHSATLLRRPGIAGVGVEKAADGQFVIVLHVSNARALQGARLPEQLDGISVRSIVSGRYRKQAPSG